MELVDRENEVLRTLEVLLKSGLQFVIVGGYAVSSLTRHRFSVDCDAVVRENSLSQFESVLRSEGFSKAQQMAGFDESYGGRFIRYSKKIADLPISIDLLVGSLVCRGTGGSWSSDYIFSNSVEANVPGIQFSVKGKIPSRELLLAFKLHSARKADVRDIVMLSDDADWDRTFGHLERGDRGKLRDSLHQVLHALEDKRLVHSLKGVFSVKEGVGSNIEKTRDRVTSILSEVSAPHV